MTLTVLDASAAAAWMLRSQWTDSAERLLASAGERTFIAPHIFPVEVRSLMLKAERRGAPAANLELNFAIVERVNVKVRQPDDEALLLAYALARVERLSIYDALYLQLALREDAELASRDEALLTAAAAHGVLGIDLNG